MTRIRAYAASSATEALKPFELDRRQPLPDDVEIDILYCGVCHSDLHTARNEWGNTVYPVVPGHEIVGRVTRVGAHVSNFKPGDLVGVGCLVDSCRECTDCREGMEQYCRHGAVFTYNSPDRHSGGMTYGGYSQRIVVNQHFVLHVPGNLNLPAVAPLLCAGITTWSPLRHWNVQAGQKVGIVGLGGLGHMGLKFAHAFGAHTVLFTTSPAKADDARRLGADEVVISKNPDEMKKHADSFDFILNTVSAPHNLDAYLELLRRDGTMCLVGVPEQPHPAPNVGNLIFRRRRLVGSLIGGLQETQQMLDFCGGNDIVSDIKIIRMDQINDAYERMLKGDVKYRFVIDIASLNQ